MQKILIILSLVFCLGFSGIILAAPVNINKASAEQLAENLNGIGIRKAQAIVQYRNKIGSFNSKEQLLNVKGIGESTIKKNEHNILIE